MPQPRSAARRRAPRWPLALVFAFAAACGPEQPGADAGASAALVEVAAARDGTVADSWTTLGSVRALERAELAAGADGAVTKVTVREGDRVEQGALLVEIDPSLAEARLASARAAREEGAESLAQASRERERAEQVGGEVLAAVELEAVGARVKELTSRHAALEAAEREAAASLARHRLKAPFAGVIAARRVDVGDWVSPGTPALDLVSTDAVEVVVDVPPELVPRLSAGMAATLHGAGEAAAEAAAVVPALDPDSRTARVRLSVAAPPPWLMAGSAVEVRFPLEIGGEGVVVPRDALVLGPTGNRVIRVVDGAAVPVSVAILAGANDDVLVRGDGLAVGDAVVVRGNERLRPGQALQVAAQEAP